MFPSALPRGTLRVSGKQNSLFPLGPVSGAKCGAVSVQNLAGGLFKSHSL